MDTRDFKNMLNGGMLLFETLNPPRNQARDVKQINQEFHQINHTNGNHTALDPLLHNRKENVDTENLARDITSTCCKIL